MPEPTTVHVAGVAGVGMSALAQLLAMTGHPVTGSDRFLDQGRRLSILDTLEQAGLALHPQDGTALSPETRALVISTAIEDDNPEVQRARALGIPILHRAEMLARLAAYRKVVAVAGTAGKSTITAMIGWIMEQAGLDPTVVNGAPVSAWQAPDRVGNVRHGASDLWVLEADESDRSLLWFHPDAAVISNVAKDHFELDEVAALFREFCQQVRGPVLCGPGVRAVLGELPLHEVEGTIGGGSGAWRVSLEGETYPVRMLGRHNAENALLAIALCRELDVPCEVIRDAIKRFGGVERRLQRVGGQGDIQVVDDYAHNPMKMEAAWRAVSAPGRRVIGVWRPHGFSPLALMFEEYVEALAGCIRPVDRLYLLPVFYAGGTASGARSSEDLARTLCYRDIETRVCADYEELATILQGEDGLKAGDTVLVMGARDPGLPAFAGALADWLNTR